MQKLPAPVGLWQAFDELSRIPRDSKHENQARAYVAERARALGLESRSDRAGNLVVVKPGREGTVILQAHLDMVCEKDEGTIHDFERDPIRLVRDGGWIRAQGTTLGADNGIGVAAMLALMEDRDFVHPRLELLFTVDEETGLTGAMLMEQGFVTGERLINLDSEQEGTIIVGCAGGKDTTVQIPIARMRAPEGAHAYLLKVGGLKGGHSGTDIHAGRGNAIRLLARTLGNLPTPFHLAVFSGGNKHNAIPREASALIVVAPEERTPLTDALAHWNAVFRRELKGIDDEVRLTLEQSTTPDTVMIPGDASRVLSLLTGLPHGVLDVDMANEAVMSSTNLAVCRTEVDHVTISTSQRGTIASIRDAIAAQVAALGALAGAAVTHKHVYPAWRPDYAAPLLTSAKGVYRELFGKPPHTEVIHAGLECGVIGDKIPGIEMISIGPTIEQAHSPYERVSIKSVERFWRYLSALLAALAQQPTPKQTEERP